MDIQLGLGTIKDGAEHIFSSAKNIIGSMAGHTVTLIKTIPDLAQSLPNHMQQDQRVAIGAFVGANLVIFGTASLIVYLFEKTAKLATDQELKERQPLPLPLIQNSRFWKHLILEGMAFSLIYAGNRVFNYLTNYQLSHPITLVITTGLVGLRVISKLIRKDENIIQLPNKESEDKSLNRNPLKEELPRDSSTINSHPTNNPESPKDVSDSKNSLDDFQNNVKSAENRRLYEEKELEKKKKLAEEARQAAEELKKKQDQENRIKEEEQEIERKKQEQEKLRLQEEERLKKEQDAAEDLRKKEEQDNKIKEEQEIERKKQEEADRVRELKEKEEARIKAEQEEKARKEAEEAEKLRKKQEQEKLKAQLEIEREEEKKREIAAKTKALLDQLGLPDVSEDVVSKKDVVSEEGSLDNKEGLPDVSDDVVSEEGNKEEEEVQLPASLSKQFGIVVQNQGLTVALKSLQNPKVSPNKTPITQLFNNQKKSEE